LISVVDDRGYTIVQFSHFSVKEYLTSMRITEGRVPRHHTPLEPAHFLVTRTCLSILLELDDEITEEDFPLVKYAADYWVKHAKLGNALSQTEDMVKRLFDPRNPHFLPWISVYNNIPTNHPMDEVEFSRQTPLYYAALFNLCGVAEWLVNERSQNVSALSGPYGTPLHAASASGSLGAMQFLLTCHADGNCVSDDHTLFYVASEGGQVTILRVLPDEDPNINTINEDGETPLTVALRHGPMKTLTEATNLLLGHGANPNPTGRGQSPIYEAVARGHHDVMHLLQKHGVDLRTRNHLGETLLNVASENGHLKVARGLLEFGADISSRDNLGRTPLHVIHSKSEDVALLLLERGADADVRDDDGRAPLHFSTGQGSLKFAQQLLELGADVNPRDNQGRTAPSSRSI